jgi:hypothetical protein
MCHNLVISHNMHMPKSHQIFLHGFGKEREMCVLRTPTLCIHIPIQVGLRQ